MLIKLRKATKEERTNKNIKAKFIKEIGKKFGAQVIYKAGTKSFYYIKEVLEASKVEKEVEDYNCLLITRIGKVN